MKISCLFRKWLWCNSARERKRDVSMRGELNANSHVNALIRIMDAGEGQRSAWRTQHVVWLFHHASTVDVDNDQRSYNSTFNLKFTTQIQKTSQILCNVEILFLFASFNHFLFDIGGHWHRAESCFFLFCLLFRLFSILAQKTTELANSTQVAKECRRAKKRRKQTKIVLSLVHLQLIWKLYSLAALFAAFSRSVAIACHGEWVR